MGFNWVWLFWPVTSSLGIRMKGLGNSSSSVSMSSSDDLREIEGKRGEWRLPGWTLESRTGSLVARVNTVGADNNTEDIDWCDGGTSSSSIFSKGVSSSRSVSVSLASVVLSSGTDCGASLTVDFHPLKFIRGRFGMGRIRREPGEGASPGFGSTSSAACALVRFDEVENGTGCGAGGLLGNATRMRGL